MCCSSPAKTALCELVIMEMRINLADLKNLQMQHESQTVVTGRGLMV